jgi:hypothetical protein
VLPWKSGPSGVQFHDILYKTFRDILYTPARRCGGWSGGKQPAPGRGMAWRTRDVEEQCFTFGAALIIQNRPGFQPPPVAVSATRGQTASSYIQPKAFFMAAAAAAQA